MRTTFDYKGIEIIAMGDEEEIARFINRLVGNEPKKDRKKPEYRDKEYISCKKDFTPSYSLQKICDKCKEENPKISETQPPKKYNFRSKPCAVCKNEFTPYYGAQKRCDDCRKEGLKIPKKEKKPPIRIQPPSRKCFGKKYEYGSAFCTNSCAVRINCKTVFEDRGK
jgi:hypothetical protein